MSDTTSDTLAHRISPELGRSWGWLAFLGIVLLVGGVALLVAPLLGGFVVTTWVAAIFLVAGVFQVIHAFRARGWKSGVWHGLSGVIYLIGGIVALLDPIAGALALTVVLSATFIVDGIVRIALAFNARPTDNWGWILVSGIVSLLVGGYIFFVVGSAPASLALLGIFAGVAFVFEGIAFLMLSLSARRHHA